MSAEVFCGLAGGANFSTTQTLTGGVTYLLLHHTDGNAWSLLNPTISVTLDGSDPGFPTMGAGVVGWLITEDPTPPVAASFLGSVPTDYALGADGLYILYGWVVDEAGNVSVPVSETTVFGEFRANETITGQQIGPAVASLGADCVEKKMKDKHRKLLAGLLQRAGLGRDVDPSSFRRYGSARKLYHFSIDNVDAY